MPALTAREAASADNSKLVVFAAASFKTALDEINAQWFGRTGKRATISYAASSELAKQIEQGAPADIFVSADLAWMDYLAQRELIRAETRSDIVGNLSRGEVPLGIVYESDAITDPAVEPVGTFPSSTHPAIIYPVAITTDATSPDANAFIEELKSPCSRATFEKQGFSDRIGGQRRTAWTASVWKT